MSGRRFRFFFACTMFASATVIACTLARPLDYLTEGGPDARSDAANDSAPIPMPVDPDAGFAVVASGLFSPTSLAHDRDNLYWYNNDGTVTMVPKASGGAVQTIASRSPPTAINALAVDPDPVNGMVYVAFGDYVVRVPKSTRNGTLTEEVDRQAPAATQLAADENHVFVMREALGVGPLFRIAKDGTKVALSGNDEELYGLALEGDNVLWATGDDVCVYCVFEQPKTAPPDASTKKVHSSTNDDLSPDAPVGFAVDAESVFWITDNRVYKVPRTGRPEMPINVYSGPAHDSLNAYHLALDATSIFVLDIVDGTLVQVSKEGGLDIKELARDLRSPTSFVVDDTAVYVAIQRSTANKDSVIARFEKKR